MFLGLSCLDCAAPKTRNPKPFECSAHEELSEALVKLGPDSQSARKLLVMGVGVWGCGFRGV